MPLPRTSAESASLAPCELPLTGIAWSLLAGTPHIPLEVNSEPYNLLIYGRMDANDASTLIAAALAGIGAVCAGAAGSAVHRTRELGGWWSQEDAVARRRTDPGLRPQPAHP